MTALTSRRALLCGIAVFPVMGGAAAAAPSDLMRACDWAWKRRLEIDRLVYSEDWTDERFDIELAKVDAVFRRAIAEPSVDLRDVSAKARLALEDYERFTAVPGTHHDDGERIVLTVLREVAALCA